MPSFSVFCELEMHYYYYLSFLYLAIVKIKLFIKLSPHVLKFCIAVITTCNIFDLSL